MSKKEIVMYHNEKINSLEDIENIFNESEICYDKPDENRCVCRQCFKITITINHSNNHSKEEVNRGI